MCCRLVSAFFTEMVQQIHSLRAKGVRLFQASAIAGFAKSAVRISLGMVCTTGEASLVMGVSVPLREVTVEIHSVTGVSTRVLHEIVLVVPFRRPEASEWFERGHDRIRPAP